MIVISFVIVLHRFNDIFSSGEKFLKKDMEREREREREREKKRERAKMIEGKIS